MKNFRNLLFVALVAVSGMGAGGCGANNPVTVAAGATAENRPETIAFALYASYVVVSEDALALARRPETPPAVRTALKKAHSLAAPAAERMQDVAAEYNNVRAAYAAGDTTLAGKVATTLSELNRVITEGAPKLGALADAYRGSNIP